MQCLSGSDGLFPARKPAIPTHPVQPSSRSLSLWKREIQQLIGVLILLKDIRSSGSHVSIPAACYSQILSEHSWSQFPCYNKESLLIGAYSMQAGTVISVLQLAQSSTALVLTLIKSNAHIICSLCLKSPGSNRAFAFCLPSAWFFASEGNLWARFLEGIWCKPMLLKSLLQPPSEILGFLFFLILWFGRQYAAISKAVPYTWYVAIDTPWFQLAACAVDDTHSNGLAVFRPCDLQQRTRMF